MKKVSARWVPRLISSVQKKQRVTLFRNFLEMCQDKEKEALNPLLPGMKQRFSTMIPFQKGVNRMAQTRRSTIEKDDGLSVHRDHGNNLLGLRGYSLN